MNGGGGGGGGFIDYHAAAYNAEMILSNNVEFHCRRRDVGPLLTQVSANKILVILPANIYIHTIDLWTVYLAEIDNKAG